MGYCLIHNNLRTLTPGATESVSVAFDADLPCQGDFSDKNLYTKIHTIYKLLIVLPVSSVCCERSFLGLHRRKTWARSKMMGELCVA